MRPAAIAVVSVATFLVVAGCTATPDETDSPPVPDDVWSVELTEAIVPAVNVIIQDDLLVVDHLEGRISVLALDSGRQLWSLPEETRTTVVVDEAIVAVDKDDTITVFDIADGTERFQHDISGHFGDTVDVTATAIVAAEQSESSDEKRTLFALSTETGDRLWERELANPPEDETTIAAPVGELQVDSPGARVVTPRLRSAVDSPVVYLTSEGSGSPRFHCCRGRRDRR